MSEEQTEKEVLNKISKYIRTNSSQGNIVERNELKEIDLELSDEEIDKKIEILKSDNQFNDIRVLSGEEGRYIFSDDSMTKKYATMMAKVEEDNLKELIAETVREDSKIYPRPTDIKVFKKSPFYLEEDVLNQVIDQMVEETDYKDIKKIVASNGALYLYSNAHMEEDHAIGLTEWVEVIRKEIP
ncbi:MAG: hypothetical protein K9K76_02125 [Halanaerobiales bacterium]|nr:hypothetical protein [Halanaerobiales bacterium]